MHELSLCRAIAGVVKSHAAGRRVEVMRVRVGALRQVVPDSLTFCWTPGPRSPEDMPTAELELELVAAEVRCHSCGQLSEVVSRWSVACPRCASATSNLGGQRRGVLVTSVDVV